MNGVNWFRHVGNRDGITLIELVAVLLVMGILTAVILERLLDIDAIREPARLDRLKNHIRFAQTMAIKKNNRFWGIRCDGTLYWLFRTDNPNNATEPEQTSNIMYLPGEDDQKVNASSDDPFKVFFTVGTFTIYFDRYGMPYTYVSGVNEIRTLVAQGLQTLDISFGSTQLRITGETGYIQ
ncbi:hypothetical protein D3OALGA1CA_3687 [Olavius algarvensis associated proteobacterium Delta 3]|nr:hypothetical protein D3OALGA1CA_3687 [Olavius algarvensis associated proteobacterium Delta 3]